MADGEVKTQVSHTSEATDKIAEILATFNMHIEQLAGHSSELTRAFENDPTAQSVHQPEAAPAPLTEPTSAPIPAAAAALIPEPDPAAEADASEPTSE